MPPCTIDFSQWHDKINWSLKLYLRSNISKNRFKESCKPITKRDSITLVCFLKCQNKKVWTMTEPAKSSEDKLSLKVMHNFGLYLVGKYDNYYIVLRLYQCHYFGTKYLRNIELERQRLWVQSFQFTKEKLL